MKKLKLEQLKVKSFVTALEEEKAHTVKGGLEETNPKVCLETAGDVCIDTCFCTGTDCNTMDIQACPIA
jgi:hypothetical protein